MKTTGITRFIFLVSVTVVVLAACNRTPRPKQIPEVGGLDTLAVVADTTMQLGIEKSYEFNKALALNENEVFDVEARGEPKEGILQFIYRNKDGRDTVLKTSRMGIVKGCWLTADMNRNGQPEIIITLQNTDNRKLESVAAYEIAKDRKLEPLVFNVQMPQQFAKGYRGGDSIVYNKDDNTLYHWSLFSEKDTVNLVVKYKLKRNKFEADGFATPN